MNCFGCCSSSDKFCSIHLGYVDQALLRIQVGAALVAVVSTVALATILALHPTGAYPAMITLGVLEGAAFITFAFAGYTARRARLYKEQEIENRRRIEEFETRRAKPVSVAPKPSEPVTTSVEVDPIQHLVQTIFPPLFDAFNRLMQEVIIADCETMHKPIGERLDLCDTVFAKDGPKLFNFLMEDPELYLTELLRYFGRGKDRPSVALRRLVAAYNSGSPKKYAQVKTEYETLMHGYDFSDIAKRLLRQPSNQKLLQDFPEMLERHFCIINDPMKKIGHDLLDFIFKKAENNPDVHCELNKLRQKARTSENFVEDVENFVKFVFEKAGMSKKEMEGWNKTLVKITLGTEFKKSTCYTLGMIARNIRILGLLFEEKKNPKVLFPMLDTIFLLSETSESILPERESLQKRLFEVQSQINYNRKWENRVALIAINQEIDPEKLTSDICKHDIWISREKLNVKLTRSEQGLVDNLQKKLGTRIIALPVPATDHPFKKLIAHERSVRFGATLGGVKLLRTLLPNLVKPKLMEKLPKLEGEKRNAFDRFFNEIIELFIDPVLDGAIRNTDFKPHFAHIITTEGVKLAEKLEDLVTEANELAKKDEQLPFEKIRDVWVEALDAVAQKFYEVVHPPNATEGR